MDAIGQSPAWKASKPFFNGGLAGMGATCIIQPIDMVKARRGAFPPPPPLASTPRRASPAAASLSPSASFTSTLPCKPSS